LKAWFARKNIISQDATKCKSTLEEYPLQWHLINKSKLSHTCYFQFFCKQKCVTILVVVKHLKVTIFQSLAIHYFVPYDAFNVSLVESLSYVEMQKNKELIICFRQDKISEAIVDWR